MSLRSSQRMDEIIAVIKDSPWHMDILEHARALGLNDWMIGAGFVRNAVWDHLHGYSKHTVLSDIDVIYFDPNQLDPSFDLDYEAQLSIEMPNVPWSVRNQARMHARNGDQPYTSTENALAHWLETPTSVAVKLDDGGALMVFAPHGVDDLLSLQVKPTSSGYRKPDVYRGRLAQKKWQCQWPDLQFFYAD